MAELNLHVTLARIMKNFVLEYPDEEYKNDFSVKAGKNVFKKL